MKKVFIWISYLVIVYVFEFILIGPGNQIKKLSDTPVLTVFLADIIFTTLIMLSLYILFTRINKRGMSKRSMILQCCIMIFAIYLFQFSLNSLIYSFFFAIKSYLSLIIYIYTILLLLFIVLISRKQYNKVSINKV